MKQHNDPGRGISIRSLLLKKAKVNKEKQTPWPLRYQYFLQKTSTPKLVQVDTVKFLKGNTRRGTK